MKNCVLLLAAACAVASFVFLGVANEAVPGVSLASQVCSTADWLCHRPFSLALAAAGLAGVWVLIMIIRTIFD
jgi:hypothetical protein